MTNSTSSDEVREAELAVKQAEKRYLEAKEAQNKALLKDLETVLAPCRECDGTGVSYWQDDEPCTDCDGEGCERIPVFTGKKDYASAFELIDTLFDGE